MATQTPVQSHLNRVPIELRVLILSFIPDIRALKNLVLSSSIYYQTYIATRALVLSAMLKNQYGLPLLGEGLLIVRAGNLRPRRKRPISDHGRRWMTYIQRDDWFNGKRREQVVQHQNDVIALLDTYRRDQTIHQLPHDRSDFAPASFVKLPLVLSEGQRLARLFVHIDWLVDKVSPDLWRKGSSREDGTRDITLSDLERTRITRAALRIQTYCTIFGPLELTSRVHTAVDEVDLKFSAEETCGLFFCLFPFWEFEEIACINDYLADTYHSLLRDLNDDIYDDSTSDVVEMPYPGTFTNSNSPSRQREDGLGWRSELGRDRLPLLGLSYFRKVCLQSTDQDRAYVLSCELQIPGYSEWKDIMHWMSANQGPLVYPAEMYEEDYYVDLALSRRKDSLDDSKLPNKGWLWTHGCKNDFGFMPTDTLFENMFQAEHRAWGYVFWDEERLLQDGVPIRESQ